MLKLLLLLPRRIRMRRMSLVVRRVGCRHGLGLFHLSSVVLGMVMIMEDVDVVVVPVPAG